MARVLHIHCSFHCNDLGHQQVSWAEKHRCLNIIIFTISTLHTGKEIFVKTYIKFKVFF